MRGFPVVVDGPSEIAMFAYNNQTFIVKSYLPEAEGVKILVKEDFTRRKDLVTGEMIVGRLPPPQYRRNRAAGAENRVAFDVVLPPHSYEVFRMESDGQTSSQPLPHGQGSHF